MPYVYMLWRSVSSSSFYWRLIDMLDRVGVVSIGRVIDRVWWAGGGVDCSATDANLLWSTSKSALFSRYESLCDPAMMHLLFVIIRCRLYTWNLIA